MTPIAPWGEGVRGGGWGRGEGACLVAVFVVQVLQEKVLEFVERVAAVEL
jgi:hypothetical protein